MDKKKEHIVFLVSSGVYSDQRIMRITHSLKESGYEVSILGIQRYLPFDSELPINAHLIRPFIKNGPLFYLEMNLRFFCILFRHPASVIVANDVDTCLGARLCQLLTAKKIIFDSHEYFTEVPELASRNIVKSIWRTIARFSLKKVSLAYTVNQELAFILSREYNLDFKVIKNVPSSYDIKNEDKREFYKKILIYQGAINEGRGLELYIKALQYLPDYHLWIVGTGDLDQKIISMIHLSAESARIQFWGMKEPAELRRMTSQAYLGLNLLDPESKNYYYSLANKFFDYMHAGIPSINMNFPVYSAYLHQCKSGLVVEDYSVDSLVKAIKKITPKKYQEMVIAAEKGRKIFCWENEEKKLLELYSAILEP